MEAPKGGGPKNFALFFPPPATIFFLLSLSWGPFVEFWWSLKRRGPEMCTFGLSGCRVKPRRPGLAATHLSTKDNEACPPAPTCELPGTYVPFFFEPPSELHHPWSLLWVALCHRGARETPL